MKHVVLICLLFLGYGISPLPAGSVVTIANSPEVTGKLTLTPAAIRVETGTSPAEINLSDVLEADFGETPFQLDYFFSGNGAGAQLPSTWKNQDIGTLASPGSVVDADGTWTLSGSGVSSKSNPARVSDNLFFAGQPWTGNGQWTARVKEIDVKTPETMGGLMLRDTLAANSSILGLGATTQGFGWIAIRAEAGKPWQGPRFSMDLPIWLRLTRYGASVFAASSSDGKAWDTIGQFDLKIGVSPWIGLFVDSHNEKVVGKAVVDQISFTPTPCSAQVLPPGVLLQSGSFLAGSFDHLGFDAANPDATGNFRRNGKIVAIPRSKIAAVTLLPTARSQLTDMGSRVGLLMQNGDVMEGDFDSINSRAVIISSVLLGMTTYNQSEVRACFLHPLQEQPASYEIRLRDGSIVNATSLSVTNNEALLGEVSGINISVSLDEIAQFRTGTAQVQSLAELDWRATPPPAAPVANAVPAANSAPATNAPPVAPTIPDLLPPVQCWEGKNQEQILEAPAGTILDFPLTGKFRAMSMRITLSPDSPPNAQVTVRVLADGKEIGRTPPFKAGDQPRFMQVTLQSPKTVTLQADSIFAGAKVLFIDPVVIRDK